MLFLRKPAPDVIRRFIDHQRGAEFTYDAVGATATDPIPPPDGFTVDHTRVELGSGEKTFMAAKAALLNWQQFGLGWLEASPADTPIQAGEVVSVVARAAGFWWLNACRIVYVIDESSPSERFGFGYGTLPGHVGSGEERFMIEWNRKGEGEVWYDILAFSRPRHFLARVGYPFVRQTQKRFGLDSAAIMKRAVNDA